MPEVWDDATAQLAARAISLGALLDFYHSLPAPWALKRLGYGLIRASKERMPHFDPTKHTTEDVVRQAGAIYSKVMMGRRSYRCPPAAKLMAPQAQVSFATELTVGRSHSPAWSPKKQCYEAEKPSLYA